MNGNVKYSCKPVNKPPTDKIVEFYYLCDRIIPTGQNVKRTLSSIECDGRNRDIVELQNRITKDLETSPLKSFPRVANIELPGTAVIQAEVLLCSDGMKLGCIYGLIQKAVESDSIFLERPPLERDLQSRVALGFRGLCK